MNKKTIYLFGLITLILFPIPTILVQWHFQNIKIIKIFELNKLLSTYTFIGIEFGILYAFLSILLLNAPIFDKLPNKIEQTIQAMNLTIFDCLFLSFCAGFGEEILFRSGFQFYFGPLITSVLFIAIHGYFNPKSWIKSLYGIMLLPFILILSYGFKEFGLWFAIGMHFSYDFILFYFMRKSTQ